MKIPSKLKRISKRETRALPVRGLKLMEEAGEMSAEILKLMGEKGSKGKTKKQIREHLWLEAIDVMIMAMDLLVHTGAKDEDINKIFNHQLDKWEAKMFIERTVVPILEKSKKKR